MTPSGPQLRPARMGEVSQVSTGALSRQPAGQPGEGGDILRDLEMAFLGKIAASMTHEIKNTFAIILESAGLLSDIITFSKEGSFPHKEKFVKVLGNIHDQVNRGVDISTRLNQFAHSMDEPLTSVHLPSLLGQIVMLMRRLAKRRGIELQADSQGERAIMSDPFRLLLVLGSVIETLADHLEPGGEIRLQLLDATPGAAILVATQGSPRPEWENSLAQLFASLKEVVEVLPAKLAISSPPEREGVLLTLPTA
jgi:signal transduction histidine kinase